MKTVWLVGAGEMAKEYIKVLKKLETNIVVIGRGKERAAELEKEFDVEVKVGGLTSFLSSKPQQPDAVINAVGIEMLTDTTIELLEYGIKNILLEKPGVGYASELKNLIEITKSKNANIVLAYNRRFFASVLKLKELIEEDGGVESFSFEFTEWSHVIGELKKHHAEHQNWFLGNSTHIVDTVFYLCGKPQDFKSFVKGENELDWHKASSNYAGAGITEKGALFSYSANWKGPGRWWFDIVTKKRRYIFKPIEQIQVQEIGSVAVNPIEGVDYSLDEQFKPGLFLQTKSFLEGDLENFCTIEEQYKNVKDYYIPMSGYDKIG